MKLVHVATLIQPRGTDCHSLARVLQHETRSKATLRSDEGSASARGGSRILLGELRHQAQGSASPAVARGRHGVVGRMLSITETRTGGISVSNTFVFSRISYIIHRFSFVLFQKKVKVTI